MSLLAIPVSVVVTLALAYALTRVISQKFQKFGIAGKDIHKLDRPLRAEMGGLSVLIAVPIGSVFLLYLDPSTTFVFITGLATILLVGAVGVFDDLFSIKQRYKPFLVAGASIPLAWSLFSTSGINFPVVGEVQFGILFPIFIVPLAITTSANFANMLAGFNGLEAGYAAIAIGTLAGLAGYQGNWDASLLGLLFLVAYLGFLRFNWYPAKVFPGDTGTLMAGAAIAAIGLISGLEFAAILVSMPAALDFTLKMMTRNPFSSRTIYGDTKVDGKGILHPPNYAALSHAFMRVSPTSERGLVLSLLGLEALYAMLAVVLTLGVI
jgi:UDP-N-acetylglucosamine--dolichyl-phosphate N-acetylglucosaminephosphotransferase